MDLGYIIQTIFTWIGNIVAPFIITVAAIGVAMAINAQPPKESRTFDRGMTIFCILAVYWAVWWVGNWW